MEYPHIHIENVGDVDLMGMLCGGDVYVMWRGCASTVWSFHMSTSTHWTNSSHTPSPVLFLTDQHNASQTLINTKASDFRWNFVFRS